MSTGNTLPRLGNSRLNPLANVLEVGGIIGRGGFGEVRRARYKDTPGPDVAVKILTLAEDEQLARRQGDYVRREIGILSRIQRGETCGNIVRLLEVYRAGRTFFLIMELCSGGDLVTAMQRGRLAPRDQRMVLHGVLSGLAHLHALGIVHGHIRLDSLLLPSRVGDPSGVKIADFGLARASWADSDSELGLDAPFPSVLSKNSSGALGSSSVKCEEVAGSLDYMAPEVLRHALRLSESGGGRSGAALSRRARSHGSLLRGGDLVLGGDGDLGEGGRAHMCAQSPPRASADDDDVSSSTLRQGAPPVSSAADLWGAGCCMFAMAAGRLPFDSPPPLPPSAPTPSPSPTSSSDPSSSPGRARGEVGGTGHESQMEEGDIEGKLYEKVAGGYRLPDDLRAVPGGYQKRARGVVRRILVGDPPVPDAGLLSPEGADLLARLLHRDPTRRISAAEALKHPFFSSLQPPPAPPPPAAAPAAAPEARLGEEKAEDGARPRVMPPYAGRRERRRRSGEVPFAISAGRRLAGGWGAEGVAGAGARGNEKAEGDEGGHARASPEATAAVAAAARRLSPTIDGSLRPAASADRAGLALAPLGRPGASADHDTASRALGPPTGTSPLAALLRPLRLRPRSASAGGSLPGSPCAAGGTGRVTPGSPCSGGASPQCGGAGSPGCGAEGSPFGGGRSRFSRRGSGAGGRRGSGSGVRPRPGPSTPTAP